MTERGQNADFRRKPLTFADSPLLLELQAFPGSRKPQKTGHFAENRIFSQGDGRRPRIRKVHFLRAPRQGGFWQKGVFCRIQCHAQEKEKESENYPWMLDPAAQHIWHTERCSQGRRAFLQKPPSKNPLFFQKVELRKC